MDKKRWVVYLIRCSDESLYCGITNNLKNRLIAHNSGKGAKYTRSRSPVELVAASSKMTKSDALKLEFRVKQIPASKKNLEFTNEENKMTKNLKKNLQNVNKDLKTLAKKVDGIIIAIDKLEKPKATKKPKVKPTKGKAVKKTPIKKAAVKKAAPATAADIILGIIDVANKSVNTATLMKKTRFTEKKIANLVYKLKKQGKIKRVGKGVYVKA
jgi:putative endonuclease